LLFGQQSDSSPFYGFGDRSERDRLLKKVGQLTVEVDFFAEACERAGLKKK
jgi:hypothetical protein